MKIHAGDLVEHKKLGRGHVLDIWKQTGTDNMIATVLIGITREVVPATELELMPQAKDNSYIAFYQNKRIEVRAKTTLEARNAAAKHWKVAQSKQYLITVILAEKDGEPVTHKADF